MKKYFSTLLFVYASFVAYGQALVVDSTRFIGGAKGGMLIQNAIPTVDKGILFCGWGVGYPGEIIPYFSLDTVYPNVLIGKIDSNQKISWMKVYGGSEWDDAWSACQTSDGGYAVLSNTMSPDGNVTGLRGANDLWLLRIDANGNLLWQRTFGSGYSDVAISVATTPDSGFIILGATNGSDGDVPFHYGSSGNMDWLVVKTDSLGNLQWSKNIGGTGDERYFGSIIAAAGGYYLFSSTQSCDHDCIDTGWHVGSPTASNFNLFKLDTSGNILWNKSYGGSGSDYASQAIYDASDNTIVMAGSTSSNNYMVTDFKGVEDIWIVKVDMNGNMIWQKTLGTKEEDERSAICRAGNGGYVVYATTWGGNIGKQDAFLSLIDNSGNEVVSKIFGGTKHEFTRSIVPYLGTYAACGLTQSVVFTEGSCYGRFSTNESGFISYLDYWPTAISDPKLTEVKIYPNPANKNVRILFGAYAQSISIFNAFGQEVYTRNDLTQSFDDVNVENWPKGLYVVQCKSEEGNVAVAKMIKN